MVSSNSKTVVNRLLKKSAVGNIIDSRCPKALCEDEEFAELEMADDSLERMSPAGGEPAPGTQSEIPIVPKGGREIEFKATWVYITYIGISENSDSGSTAKETTGGDHV